MGSFSCFPAGFQGSFLERQVEFPCLVRAPLGSGSGDACLQTESSPGDRVWLWGVAGPFTEETPAGAPLARKNVC